MLQRDIDRLIKQFSENGIEKDRLIFDNKKEDSHFKNYIKCDIALDPVPFSGLTITIEQAHMGVPTLTMPGDTISSRGAARVNKAIGLKDFIAKNEKDYVKKASTITSNIEKLRYYRKNLPTIIENSILCTKFEKYTQEIEKEYKKAWRKFCR